MSVSVPYPSASDYDGVPQLVEPEIRRLGGEVREASGRRSSRRPPTARSPTCRSTTRTPHPTRASSATVRRTGTGRT